MCCGGVLQIKKKFQGGTTAGAVHPAEENRRRRAARRASEAETGGRRTVRIELSLRSVFAIVAVVLGLWLLARLWQVLLVLAVAAVLAGTLYALLPRSFHVRTARVLLDLETVVGGYVRGQAITSVLIALYVFAVLTVAGTPNALALAVLAALADLIPFVGGVLALTPAVLATLGLGAGKATAVGVAILLYLWFESQLLVPHVYGRTLRLSPVTVTVALLAGGELLGIVGALLALPLAAAVRVLIVDLRVDLPGEQPDEGPERAAEERAETAYAARTAGAPAGEAAAVAARLAEELHARDEATPRRAKEGAT
jgi:predicted PurR-regulated permease PerM